MVPGFAEFEVVVCVALGFASVLLDDCKRMMRHLSPLARMTQESTETGQLNVASSLINQLETHWWNQWHTADLGFLASTHSGSGPLNNGLEHRLRSGNRLNPEWDQLPES
jgi:hypothetical protein